MQIDVPPGMRGIVDNLEEMEILLQYGHKMKITSKTVLKGVDGRTLNLIRMELDATDLPTGLPPSAAS